jgi:hypothetical protein
MHNNKSSNILGSSEISTISNTLLTLETVSLSAGIPIIPQNSKRQLLKKSYFSPTEEYIKSSLVTVTTPKLSEFIKLLESENIDDKIKLKELEIKNLIEILYFPVIIFALIFSFVLSVTLPASTSLDSTLISSTVSALGGFVSSFFTTTNNYRYFTFKNILSSELDRRQGRFGSFPTRKVQISSLGMTTTNNQDLLC